MRAQYATVGPLVAANATNIRTASAIAGAGAVTLNGTLVSGGIATLDTQRRVLITNASNETIIITLVGTTNSGTVQTENIQLGLAGSSPSLLDYATLTSVTSSAASAGNISIGTNGVAGSPWVAFDRYSAPQIGFQIDVSGTVNYTVQATYDDPSSSVNPVLPAAMAWFSAGDSTVVAATASAQSSFAVLPVYARIVLNSQTNPGFVTGTFVQPSYPT